MLRDFPLPARVAAHAEAFAAASHGAPATGGGVPVTPRRACTVVLLRDGDGEPEAFVMRRTATMAFAASMHVFPGGGVDPRDSHVHHDGEGIPWRGPTVFEWARMLGTDEPSVTGLICAAVRELFEECGVLLASPPGGSVIDDLTSDGWEQDRLALLDRTVALSDLLKRRGLELRSDLLTAWSRWCTPVFEPRRYDTWFFAAALPPGQCAREVGGEADSAAWLPASLAAEQGAAGRLAMMPPTVVTLEEVAALPDVATLLGARRTLQLRMPWMVRSTTGLRLRVDLADDGRAEAGPTAGIEDAL